MRLGNEPPCCTCGTCEKGSTSQRRPFRSVLTHRAVGLRAVRAGPCQSGNGLLLANGRTDREYEMMQALHDRCRYCCYYQLLGPMGLSDLSVSCE
jgi:hypothetical protein